MSGSGRDRVETTPAIYSDLLWARLATVSRPRTRNGKQETSQQFQPTYFVFDQPRRTSWAAIHGILPHCPGRTTPLRQCHGSGMSPIPETFKGVWDRLDARSSDIIALGLAENVADDPLARTAPASAHFTYIRSLPTSPHTANVNCHRTPVYCGYHLRRPASMVLGNRVTGCKSAFIPISQYELSRPRHGGCG